MCLRGTAKKIKWEPIISQAADIVSGYDTGVTLRQLFYRLVAAELLPNTQAAYKSYHQKQRKRGGTAPFLTLLTGRALFTATSTLAVPMPLSGG